MVSYKCERCKKKFSHRGDYSRHIERKKICKIVVDEQPDSDVEEDEVDEEQEVVIKLQRNQCAHCLTILSTGSNLSRHITRCKVNKNKIREEVRQELLATMNKTVQQAYTGRTATNKNTGRVSVNRTKSNNSQAITPSKTQIREVVRQEVRTAMNKNAEQVSANHSNSNNAPAITPQNVQINNSNIRLVALDKDDLSGIIDEQIRDFIAKKNWTLHTT